MNSIDCYFGIKMNDTNPDTGNNDESIIWDREPNYCEYQSVSYKEFYQAQSTGYKPEMILKVSAFDYHGQDYIKYDDVEYTVIKYSQLRDNPDDILLTLQKGIKYGDA